MGTQQLLMLLVGVIVVIFTVFVGYNIYNHYLENNNRDQLVIIINEVAINARQYLLRAKENGGGGGSFRGWNIPTNLAETDAGKLKFSVSEEMINLSAEGTEKGRDKSSNIKITGRIDKNGLRLTMIN